MNGSMENEQAANLLIQRKQPQMKTIVDTLKDLNFLNTNYINKQVFTIFFDEIVYFCCCTKLLGV